MCPILKIQQKCKINPPYCFSVAQIQMGSILERTKFKKILRHCQFNDVFRLKKVVLVARSGSHRHPVGDRHGWVVVVVVLTVCCWWSLKEQ